MLNRRLVGRQREEQLMEASDVFTRLRRSVLLHVLRQGEHKALAVVKDIDFLPLLFGEPERHHHGGYRDQSAERYDDYAEQTDLPEGCFDVF